ncbi:MAG: ATP-binding protein, partial [Panacagrimonas sp.]
DGAPDDTNDALVGRQAELDRLHAALDKARHRRRQIVFVSGEAGIGKTALVGEFLAVATRRHPGLLIGRGQCVERQGPAEAYLPVLDALGHLLREAADDQPFELLKRVAPGWLLQLPALIPADEYAALKRQAGGASHERVLRELAEALEHLSALHPVVLVLEDLHWSDTATLDLLDMLGRRVQAAALLIVATVRPADAIVAVHPVRAVHLALKAGRQASELMLSYLDAEAVTQYLRQRLNDEYVSPALVQTLHARSGGHPLFLAQLFDYLVPQETVGRNSRRRIPPSGERSSEDGLRFANPPYADLASLESALPPGLRDLIALQLAQLGPSDQLILESASAVGVEFAASSVAICVGIPVEAVEQQCDRLARQGLFIQDQGLAIWPDGTCSGRYRFRHVLYEQVLSQSLSSARRARLHRQIADRFEAAYGERTREIAGELAHHYEQAGAADKTVRYCIELARIGLERTAQDEVRLQTERGLKWLAALPPGEMRDESEMALHTAAAYALQAQFGNHCHQAIPHLEVVEHLSTKVRKPTLLESALSALWRSAHFSGRYERALVHATSVRDLGRTLAAPALESCGHAWASHSLNIIGRHAQADVEARLGIQQAEAALRQSPGLPASEPGCAAQSAHAVASWYLGFPDRALRVAQQAQAAASLIGNPYLQCLIRAIVLGNVLMFRREWAALEIVCLDTLALCEKYGHDDGVQLATQHQLMARCMCGDADALQPLLTLLEPARAVGVNLIAACVHAAEGAMRVGQLAQAHAINDRAMAQIQAHGRRAWEPEVWRVRAELLLAQDPDRTQEAEACLQRSLDISRERQGRSLELRAAVSLVRLWVSQRRDDDARALILPLYGLFDEGLETPDLVEAKALIDALRSERQFMLDD